MIGTKITRTADPVPFEEFWLPKLEQAHRQLMQDCPAYGTLVNESAQSDLLRYMLTDLHTYISLALMADFNATRSDWMTALLPTAASSSVEYTRYIAALLSDDGHAFAATYPVAMRIANGIIADRLAFYRSFLGHVAAERTELFATCNDGRDAGIITGVKLGLSDPHNGGRGVITVTFEDGLRVMYKPRSCEVDDAWQSVLVWMGAHLNMTFMSPRSLDKQDHCWVEQIQHDSLENAEDAAHFYRASGVLLAALYVLGGTDFHQENIIACGKYPVLIDVETLLRPLVRPFDYDTFDAEKKQMIRSLEGDSVLRTWMLPMWAPLDKNMFRDYGALTPADELDFLSHEWLRVNTDGMRREYVRKKTRPTPNCPHLQGQTQSVMLHTDALLAGFREACQLFLHHRKELVASDSPWSALRTCTFRFLPRNTQIYSDMSLHLRSASMLRSEETFATALQRLSKPFRDGIPEPRQSELESIAKLERDALHRHDIPIICARADDLAARTVQGDVMLEDFFLMSGWDEFCRRLDKLSADDITYQSGLIESSLAIRYPAARQRDTIPKTLSDSWNDGVPLSSTECVAAAVRIAHEIADRVMVRNGMPQWLTRKFDPMTHLLNIGRTDSSLYEGTSGIGLFLATVAQKTGDTRLRQLASDCFLPIQKMMENDRLHEWAPHFSLGYGTGFGGFLYALRETADRLADNTFFDLALRILDLPLEQAVAHDEQFDVMSGVAGTIISLMPFVSDPRVTSQRRQNIVHLAEQCGEHLLARRVPYKQYLLWPCSYSSVPLTGFAHGAAGFACALLQLHQLTGRDDFKLAALDAIAYERDVFIPERNNWPDFRVHRDAAEGEIVFMAGWCSGAPGIGLARLVTLDTLDTPEIREDIEHAVAFTLDIVRHPNPVESDHTCCGIAGRIDFLLAAAARMNRPEWEQAARKSASFILKRAAYNGRYTFNGDTSGPVFSPGLFTGLAGVGATLIKL